MSDKAKRPRVQDYGEVFTPAGVVGRMLKILEVELDPYDARVLEPACGSGNFLAPILENKLATVDRKTRNSPERRAFLGLHALMSIYGIELLADNVEVCRARLLHIWQLWGSPLPGPDWLEAASRVVRLNVLCGDALKMIDSTGGLLKFSEWSIAGDGSFERREFQFADLISGDRFGEGTIFETIPPGEIFSPIRQVAGLQVEDLARIEG